MIRAEVEASANPTPGACGLYGRRAFIGDPPLLWRAADLAGVPRHAADELQEAGLLHVGATVVFRHPLVRSATYRLASQSARRRAHRALAEATDPEADPDRRAWHRALAAPGPDEETAAELERSADRAQARGGLAAAAAFRQRALALTADADRRGSRALAAAQAKLAAGEPATARDLLAIARRSALDELQVATLHVVSARLAFALGRGGEAPGRLLKAAELLKPLDPTRAREIYSETLYAALYAGRLAANEEETSQSQQDKFPVTDVFQHIEVADGRVWLLPSGVDTFAGDLPEEEKQVVWAAATAPAADLFNQKVEGVAWRSKPSAYVVAKNDRTVQPDLQRFVAKRMGATTYEVESSHVPMLSNPNLVVDVIRTAANALEEESLVT